MSQSALKLTPHSTIREMCEVVGPLARDLVSDDFDTALNLLADVMPMTIHEYPSGLECFTWIIPEKWTCHEAYIETMDGQRLFSCADNPLHVMSYSLPFEGEVSREELDAHLYTHPVLPDAIVWRHKYYERNWGMCCTQQQKTSLTDERYKVVIKTEFSPGALKVGEVVVPGESDETIVLCGHLCHPGQVNDDLVGVAMGIDLLRELLERKKRRYTYRLVIVPETVGSAAWLSGNRELFPLLKGGLFLEMLGRDAPHALQLSLGGESEMDLVCQTIMAENDPESWAAPFLKVVLNDERMFNSPGISSPMLSLSRVLPKTHREYPFAEYHSSKDTVECMDFDAVDGSRQLVMDIIDALEQNLTPEPLFEGELFCSRYFRLDYSGMFDLIQSVPYRINGKKTVVDIAREVDLPFFKVKKFLDILIAEGLVRWKEHAS